MPSSVTYPNGQTLTSTAHTPDQVMSLFQTLTCQSLGIDPTVDTTAYSKVRVAWQMRGQPAWAITDDVCILNAHETDDRFAHAYEKNEQAIGTPEANTVTLKYTRVWCVNWVFYGPDCHDRARAVIAALRLFWTHQQLASNNLYILGNFTRPVYIPEFFVGQWWKRTDLSINFNEFVTDTTSVSTIASSEILVYDDQTGLVVDMTLPPK